MSSSIFFLFLFLTTFTPSSAQEDPSYIYHNCPNTTTFSKNSTYFTNLKTLLSSFTSLNTSYSTGFQTATIGQPPDNLTGLFLCRGDISPQDCHNCVKNLVNSTQTRCPNAKEVNLYYDKCTLRYSNRNILSTLITNGGIYMWNVQNVTSKEKDRFRDLVLSTMNDAAIEASSNSRKFDARKANFTTFQTLYGLVQCTPDLTRQECLRCLQEINNQLPTDKIGGRFIVPSCNSRYEEYAFFNESAIRIPPPPPPSPPPSPSPPDSTPPMSPSPRRSGLNSVFFLCFT